MRSPRRTRPLSNCCPERPACRPVAWLTCSFRCRPATAVSVAWIVGGGPYDGRWRLEGDTVRYEDVEVLRTHHAAWRLLRRSEEHTSDSSHVEISYAVF